MDARFHHRVAWIITAALGGVAACAGGGGGETASKTGGHDGGVASAGCLGPSWFGGLDAAARSKLVGLVCADARSGTLAAGRLDSDAGASCKGAFAVRSDDQIEAILAAVDEGEAREGKLAEANATSPAVREFAHTITVIHTRSAEQEKGRRKGRLEDSEASRGIASGFTCATAVLQAAHGPTFDEEFLARAIVQHARELEMLDALAPQVKGAGTRCAVEKARGIALAHLELACVVSGQVGAPPATARPRPPQRIGRVASGAAACTEEGSPAVIEAPAPTVEPPAASVEPPTASVATPAAPAATVTTPAEPVKGGDGPIPTHEPPVVEPLMPDCPP